MTQIEDEEEGEFVEGHGGYGIAWLWKDADGEWQELKEMKVSRWIGYPSTSYEAESLASAEAVEQLLQVLNTCKYERKGALKGEIILHARLIPDSQGIDAELRERQHATEDCRHKS